MGIVLALLGVILFIMMLYLNKKTKLPTKMEIKDDNKNTKVYILYNEITIK